ncbi:type II secretion system protein GspE [Paramixta manurensis]|uniref:Type II secretion system protein GspE n=1 Tax=Paramixta manurensis TaxID=2740817 RepID=A0A6M8UK73_9GAMM|nr:type II secretion system protein GspE [Erwiniaceae bacterium PD-1]
MSHQQRTLEALCQRYQIAILEQTAQKIKIAMAETPSAQVLEALRFASQLDVECEQWPAARLEQHLSAHEREQDASQTLKRDISQESAIERVEQLLATAVQKRASDIHIEPQLHGLRIRLRIDGVLQILPAPRELSPAAMIARLKILANLDVAERRIPQDGQFTHPIAGNAESFRLSTLPIRFGEKAVIRVLQNESQPLELDTLGMSSAALSRYRQALARPQGLILVTGPTGSGKTFTLYSGLNALNQPGRNLSSVEDPIEIPLAGVNQTQINLKTGLDFHLVLRALLRQDPDVIMLGEIRDGETAEIAVKAAQTGHLVLSTLHTNSTCETITRLSQMGIPGYLLGSALKLVIAQRLVRRLCPRCRQPATAVAHIPSALWPGTLQTWRAAGCHHCFSGYYGRLALFELLPINAKLQNAIANHSPVEMLTELAKQQGMNSLFVEGLHAVSRGETTLEEVNRVVGLVDD